MNNRIWVLCAIALAMCVNVQGQGFLKKIGDAVDKASKKMEKVIPKSSDTSKSSDANRKREPSEKKSSNLEEEDFSYDNDINSDVPKSNLFKATSDYELEGERMKQFSQFKTTANTKVIKVEQLNGLLEFGNFSDQRAFVRFDNVLICIDDKGNVVKKWTKEINDIFEMSHMLPRFDSGRILMYEGDGGLSDKAAYICDVNFKVIKKIPHVSGYTYFRDGVAFVHEEITKESKVFTMNNIREVFKFYDVNGNQVFKGLTDPLEGPMGTRTLTDEMAVRPSCEGFIPYFALTGDKKDYVWGFRDAKGKILIPAKYDKVQDFSNGMAAVATSESGSLKWGYIDTKGQMVIEPKFSKVPSRFDKCGLAMVIDKEFNCMFINKKGEVVSKKYKNVSPFNNGLAVMESDNGTELIDSNFKTVSILSRSTGFLERLFDYYRYIDFNINIDQPNPRMEGMFLGDDIYLFKNSRYIRLAKDGNVLMSNLLGPFVNGLAPAAINKNGLEYESIGYVNEQGEWVVKFEQNEF